MKILFELRPSSINGVGVFALEDIKAYININEYLFESFDNKNIPSSMCDLPYSFVNKFGVEQKEDFILIPKNPICMSIGWYLNHSDSPNVKITEFGEQFITDKEIKKGDELTIDYTQLSPVEKKPI